MFPPKLKHGKNKNKKNEIHSNKSRKISGTSKAILNNNFISNLNNNINNNANIILSKYKSILEYKDKELNTLEYKQALISDHRTYIQYYISLLKRGNLLFFSFYNNKDYNSQIIKMLLFFFFFSLYLTINALFFNDKTMHKIYMDEGIFNIKYQIPKIIYSTIISAVISSLIKFLALTENKIIEIKKEKNIVILKKKVNRIIKTLKIKFAFFYMVVLLLLLLFSYYTICFCGIYINTQTHLIKDTIISFVLSLIYPFGICLIPGLFRIPALHDKNKNKKCLYNFSIFIQAIFI